MEHVCIALRKFYQQFAVILTSRCLHGRYNGNVEVVKELLVAGAKVCAKFVHDKVKVT